LDIHEQPRLTASPDDRLRKNMIVTIEPGIYLTGCGGIRLENDILVTSRGHENLCSLPTSLDRVILR
ncbi:MAG: M24 family metallopeptidase, partial [Planctomycetes bacterium]|nr:M24 family metallopeptidase [Planctomycetota bacterium]